MDADTTEEASGPGLRELTAFEHTNEDMDHDDMKTKSKTTNLHLAKMQSHAHRTKTIRLCMYAFP